MKGLFQSNLSSTPKEKHVTAPPDPPRTLRLCSAHRFNLSSKPPSFHKCKSNRKSDQKIEHCCTEGYFQSKNGISGADQPLLGIRDRMQEGRNEYAGRESRCLGQYKTAQMSIRRMRCNEHFTSRSAEHVRKVKRRRKWLSSSVRPSSVLGSRVYYAIRTSWCSE